MEPKWLNYFVYEIIFINNVKQFKKFCHGMSVTPPSPHPIVVTTLYIYFLENLCALKINNHLENPIVIYDSRWFEKN